MWNQKHYEDTKFRVARDLKNGLKKPYDFMQEYKRMIVADDFEGAKAITEVLKPLNYDTADTHAHIKQLNE